MDDAAIYSYLYSLFGVSVYHWPLWPRAMYCRILEVERHDKILKGHGDASDCLIGYTIFQLVALV
jgi:hypothetical protein